MVQEIAHKPSREHLEWMRHLPNTASLRAQIETKGNSEVLQERLQHCLERDAIAAIRPEGCVCLGSGGHEPTYFENGIGGSEPVYFGTGCTCPEAKALEQSWVRQYTANKHARLWNAAGIPKRLEGCRFETVPQHLTSIADRMIDTGLEGSWFLWGPLGRGKTGLAISFAFCLLETESIQPLFVPVPDVLSRLRSTYGGKASEETEWSVIQEYSEAQLLILDDLGAEAVSRSGQEWLQDRLYQIIGERHSEEKQTIFTSNLNLEQLAARIGERVTWRIVEMCGENHILHVDGPNLRDRK